jgi:hypothetical protein
VPRASALEHARAAGSARPRIGVCSSVRTLAALTGGVRNVAAYML